MAWKKVQYKDGKYRTTEDSGGGGGSGHTYSTTEQDTGDVWYNGKHIYEITLIFSSALYLSDSDWSVSSPAVDSSNIEDVVMVRALHADGTGYNFIAADPTRNSHTNMGFKASTSCSVTRIIVQYTKTTD